MKLSIVATLYQSSLHIYEFYHRCTKVAREFADKDYEIILVNDGSLDNSLDIAVSLAENDNHVVVVDLSRNFGHHKAMMTGLSYAKGEKIFLIDSDLEEEPEWLINFSNQMEHENCDVVYGMQEERKGGIFEKLSGQLFYKLFKFFSGLNIPMNAVTARLMTRRYVDALLLHQERELFIVGLWHITGFNQKPLTIKKHSTSKSTYTLRLKLALTVNSITSFTNAPLVGIFYVGVIISFLACIYIAYLCTKRLVFATLLSGWTSVMASIWLFSGLIISFLGIIGIYLSKIFSETKRRPYTIVKQIHGRFEGVE